MCMIYTEYSYFILALHYRYSEWQKKEGKKWWNFLSNDLVIAFFVSLKDKMFFETGLSMTDVYTF